MATYMNDPTTPEGRMKIRSSNKYAPYYTTDSKQTVLTTGNNVAAQPSTSLPAKEGLAHNSVYTSGVESPYSIFNNMTPSEQNTYISANPTMSGTNIDMAPKVDTGSTYFGKDGVIGGLAQGVQALSGLAGAYMGYKNYGLAKDKFDYEKAATNRNIANQASEYNTGLQNRGEVGIGLAGNSMSPDQVAARNAQLSSQRISTAPIG